MNQLKISLMQLLQKMDRHFDLNELRGLSFALDVEWEELVGDNKPTKIISLIKYVIRRERLAELLALLQQQRPSVEWPDIDTGNIRQNNLAQKKPSSQSGNSITATNGGTIRVGGEIIQEGKKNSLDADSAAVIEAKKLTQRDKKK